MINSLGIIQNNTSTTDLIKFLKEDKRQYKLLSKKQEREMIDRYMKDGKEDELRKLLAMHNIRYVFSMSKQYCKNTRDFDNMVAKGLYGLVYAANKFDLYKPIMVYDKTDPAYVTDKKNCRRIPKTGKDGKTDYIKFCTYAKNWIFKYLVDEFGKKSLRFIDNMSISMNDSVKMKNDISKNQTMENYVDSMIAPDYDSKASMPDSLSVVENMDLYDFIENTNELTADEKTIVLDSFYGGKKISELSVDMNMDGEKIVSKKKNALRKLKSILGDELDFV